MVEASARSDTPRLVRVLANATNRALLIALEDGPSYPRALAHRIGITEGHVQKHLRALEDSGLVTGAWRHEGKTVKQYALCVDEVRVAFVDGRIHARAVGADPRRARD